MSFWEMKDIIRVHGCHGAFVNDEVNSSNLIFSKHLRPMYNGPFSYPTQEPRVAPSLVRFLIQAYSVTRKWSERNGLRTVPLALLAPLSKLTADLDGQNKMKNKTWSKSTKEPGLSIIFINS